MQLLRQSFLGKSSRSLREKRIALRWKGSRIPVGMLDTFPAQHNFSSEGKTTEGWNEETVQLKQPDEPRNDKTLFIDRPRQREIMWEWSKCIRK